MIPVEALNTVRNIFHSRQRAGAMNWRGRRFRRRSGWCAEHQQHHLGQGLPRKNS